MSNCTGIELERVMEERIGTLPKRYQVLAITDDMWRGILRNESKKATIKEMQKVVPDNVLKGPMQILEGHNTVDGDSLFKSTDTGAMIKLKSVALHELVSQMDSESKVRQTTRAQAKVGELSQAEFEKEMTKLTDQDTGLPLISSLGTSETIGRKFAESMGMTISQETYKKFGKKEREEKIAKFYKQMGDMALGRLADEGVINIDEVQPNQYSRLMDGTTKAGTGKSKANTRGYKLVKGGDKLIRLNSEGVQNREDIGTALMSLDGSKKAAARDALPEAFKMKLDQAYAIQKIALPSNNKKGTSSEPEFKHDKSNDAHKQTTKQIERSDKETTIAYKIGKEEIELLEELAKVKQELIDAGETVEYSAILNKAVKDGVISEDTRRDMFGLDRDKLNDAINTDKALSKQLSKTAPMKLLLEDIEYYLEAFKGDGLYVDKYAGRNDRYVVELSAINWHSSKTAREMYTMPEVKMPTKGDSRYVELQKIVLDNYSLDIDQLAYAESKESKLVKAYNGALKKSQDGGKSVVVELESLLKSTGLWNELGGHSVFGKLNVLRAMSQVKAGTDKLQFNAAVDASGSGVILKLMFAAKAGSKDAEVLLQELGVLPGGKVKYKDVYDILTQAREQAKSKGGEDTGLMAKLIALKDTKGELSTAREADKLPVMKFNYAEGAEGTKLGIGEAIVDGISESTDGIKLVQEYLGKEVTGKIDPTEVNTYVHELSNTVGNKVRELLVQSPLGKALEASDAMIEKTYKEIQLLAEEGNSKYTKNSVKLLTATDMMEIDAEYEALVGANKEATIQEKYSTLRKNGYGTPMTKVGQEISADGLTIYSVAKFNPATAKVTPQHMADRYQMDRMKDAVYAKIGDVAIVDTHDEIISTLDGAITAKEEFTKATLDIVDKYSPVQTLQMELQYALDTIGRKEEVKINPVSEDVALDILAEDAGLIGLSERKYNKRKKSYDGISSTANKKLKRALESKQDTLMRENADKVTSNIGEVTEQIDRMKDIGQRVVIDVETDPDSKEIIEIAYKIADTNTGESITEEVIKVKPTNKDDWANIPDTQEEMEKLVAEAEKEGKEYTFRGGEYVSRVTKEDLEDAITPQEAIDKLNTVFDNEIGYTFVGHNLDFDFDEAKIDGKLLSNEINAINKARQTDPINRRGSVIDTLEMSRALRFNGPGDNKLTTLSELIGLDTTKAHNAVVDIQNTDKVLEAMIEYADVVKNSKELVTEDKFVAKENEMINGVPKEQHEAVSEALKENDKNCGV